MDWQSLKGLFCPDPRRAVSIWLKFNLDFPLLCSTRLHHPISWYFFETKNVIILKHSNKYFVLIDHHQHWQLCVRRDPICAPTLSQPTPSSPKTNTHNIPFKQIQIQISFKQNTKRKGNRGFSKNIKHSLSAINAFLREEKACTGLREKKPVCNFCVCRWKLVGL